MGSYILIPLIRHSHVPWFSSNIPRQERTLRAKTADECLRNGYYEEALSLYQKELDYLRRHSLESRERDVYGLALYDVALTFSCQCKWKDAVEAGEEAMKHLGFARWSPGGQGPKNSINDANIYLVARFMADLYLYLGRYEEGESLHNRMMNTWPTDADDTVDIGNLISLAKYSYFRATKDFDHVLVIIAYAQQAMKKKEDPKFAHLYSQELNILKGYVLQAKCKYQDAGLIYQQAYDNLGKELGGEHPATVFASIRIAGIHLLRGKHAEVHKGKHGEVYKKGQYEEYKKSLSLLEAARSISELTLGKDHNNTLDAIYHTACLFQEREGNGEFCRALKLFELVRNTRTEILEVNHILSNLDFLNPLGSLSFAQEEAITRSNVSK